jgi:hypothetical protein
MIEIGAMGSMNQQTLTRPTPITSRKSRYRDVYIGRQIFDSFGYRHDADFLGARI